MSEPEPDSTNPDEMDINAEDILTLRHGPGANCSSIGSALDVLFLSAVAAGVILAGVAASIGDHARSKPPPKPTAQGADTKKESDASST